MSDHNAFGLGGRCSVSAARLWFDRLTTLSAAERHGDDRASPSIGLHLCLIFAFACVVSTASAAHTQVSLISERQAVALGESFDVGILLKMNKGWHTYWKDPGDSGLATTVTWKLPPDFVAGPIRWPKPMVIKMAGLTSYAYEDEVLLLVRIQVPSKG